MEVDRAPRDYEETLNIYLVEHFKGTKAMTMEARGHGGNHLQCLHEISGLVLKLIS